MANRVVDDAYKHVHDVMTKAKEELSNIQSEPIGREVRSKQEISSILKKLSSMSPEERNARMDEMISVSGHKGNGLDDCGLCNMIRKAAK